MCVCVFVSAFVCVCGTLLVLDGTHMPSCTRSDDVAEGFRDAESGPTKTDSVSREVVKEMENGAHAFSLCASHGLIVARLTFSF